MANSLIDYAQELEKALRNSEDYKALTTSYQTVLQNNEAKSLFEQFRDLQLQLQQKQMTGQQITEEEAKKAQETALLVQQNPYIVQLMTAEQRMSDTINQLNKIILKPLDDLYGMVDK
ncbi:YlbF family regulator [Heyndrickxia ginsengihumi]|uniref:UPF0342 protein G4D61_02840 n=1 Tax=Heyndrickxia ginsengihumi TaxID=363870 RepID=A0A0A6XWR4_9BACI|nr:YlbF family regulator [Heyndrickxia ginsengihumi]KHD84577.1 hypothetical protein NG54_14625 [Heyndrickxia ginsengihumi]MBE6184863.1 YlbF family regulator [Bacillus sp. (in: firmicutes)]MCM3022956.1 YlbF family regulator [Heyndrickxia ginsengihumi]NEY18906.1 YlbF family regulator [Heyndrickxia ginsengihumi]